MPTQETPGRGLRITWVLGGLLAFVLVAGGVVFLFRPGRALLEIRGRPGSQFLGTLTIDGMPREITGTVPAEFTFSGRRIDLAVIPRTAPDPTFTVSLNGRAAPAAPWGAEGGYMMDWGFAHHHLRDMTEPAWDDVVRAFGTPE